MSEMTDQEIIKINKTNGVVVNGITYPPGTYELMLGLIDYED